MDIKKILFLGGAYAQMPIIKEAKERGLYVITCDYLPENPGHQLADESYNVSTTDAEKVLQLAQRVHADYVFAYASDPAAPVAAYVSEKIGLPGNSYESVKALSEKDLFRDLLKKNGFNVPKAISLHEREDYLKKLAGLNFPVVVKPTDSSGSKGVSKIQASNEVEKAVEYALRFSRNKRIIIEEFIESNGRQLHGDGFVVDSELAFVYLGDHHYNEAINPFVPYATTWPSNTKDEVMNKVVEELERFMRISGFRDGAVNIEVRVDEEGKIYIMEVGPRSGGNFVPQVIRYASSFDMVKASLDVLQGRPIDKFPVVKGCAAYYVIHSEKEGILKELKIENELLPFVKEFHQYVKTGEAVASFQGSNAAIGILLLQFNSSLEMQGVMAEVPSLIWLEIAVKN